MFYFIRHFLFFLILNVINIIYFFSFHNISDSEAFKYLIARGIQFSIISVSIFFHFGFYKSKLEKTETEIIENCIALAIKYLNASISKIL